MCKNLLNAAIGDDACYIDVGTVLTFQGADRNIIILSTVSGSSEGSYFIDSNPALMNVAVSRAKDAFWVFGAYDSLSNSDKNASGLLKRYVREEIKI